MCSSLSCSSSSPTPLLLPVFWSVLPDLPQTTFLHLLPFWKPSYHFCFYSYVTDHSWHLSPPATPALASSPLYHTTPCCSKQLTPNTHGPFPNPFMPLLSGTYLQLPRFSSTCCLLSLKIKMSSAKGLRADLWCSSSSTLKPSCTLTAHLTNVSYMSCTSATYFYATPDSITQNHSSSLGTPL